MLTPRFTINQDDNYIYLIIFAPLSKISSTELNYDDNTICFNSVPYFLRLYLPGKVTQSTTDTARFIADTQSYECRATKVTPGEFFPDLEMITKLLQPPRQLFKIPRAKIENDGQDEPDENDDEIDWRMDHLTSTNEGETSVDADTLISKPSYGFANIYSGKLADFQREVPDIVDLPNADSTSISQRTILRVTDEIKKFDPEIYILDMVKCQTLLKYCKYQPWWEKDDDKDIFDQHDKEVLSSMKGRSYKLLPKQMLNVYLGLVDILFAFCYNERVTLGEMNCESGWTIRKLSSTLCWLENQRNLEDTVTSSYVRCLVFPIKRNWTLNQCIHRDVVAILRKGKKYVLKCLLDIHYCMKDDEKHYVMNDLYIYDYIIWSQYVNNEKFLDIANNLEKIEVNKEFLPFDLATLEVIFEYAYKSKQGKWPCPDNMTSESCESDSSDEKDVRGGSCGSDGSDCEGVIYRCSHGDDEVNKIKVNSGPLIECIDEDYTKENIYDSSETEKINDKENTESGGLDISNNAKDRLTICRDLEQCRLSDTTTKPIARPLVNSDSEVNGSGSGASDTNDYSSITDCSDWTTSDGDNESSDGDSSDGDVPVSRSLNLNNNPVDRCHRIYHHNQCAYNVVYTQPSVSGVCNCRQIITGKYPVREGDTDEEKDVNGVKVDRNALNF